MYKLDREKDCYENEYRLRAWIDMYEGGNFDSHNRAVMIDAGWYDWWCSDTSLKSRLDKLAPKVIQIAKSELINTEKTYVFFKNNCPMVGKLYDSFSICDIESGKVLYWVAYIEDGCYGERGSGWCVSGCQNGDWKEILKKVKWVEVKKYFGV